jgi:hypothetical protein
VISIAEGGPNEWDGSTDGDYGTATNWSASSVPDGVDATAQFAALGDGRRNVTLAAPVTLGTLTFDNANRYTLAASGGGAIRMEVASGSAAITLTTGSHTISAPLTIASDTAVTGAGTLSAGAVKVNTGKKLSVANTPKVMVAASLNLGADINAPDAGVELGDSSLIVDYTGGSPLADLTKLVKAGNPVSSSVGIYSDVTQAQSGLLGLGIRELGTMGLSTYHGVTVDSTMVLIKPTYRGDANCDGAVDGQDYSLIDAGFAAQASGWGNGDFNYDEAIDGQDYSLIDFVFGAQGPRLEASAATPEPMVMAGWPEPAKAFVWSNQRITDELLEVMSYGL